MSKNKQKKFKKSRQQVSSSVPRNDAGASISPDNTIESVVSKPETKKVDLYKLADEEYKYVRKDVGMILLTVLGLGVLIVVFFFLGEKTTLLTSFGDWIAKVCNIQTL